MRAVSRVVDRPVIGFFALAYGLAWGIWLLEVALARNSGLSTADFVAAIEDGQFELVGGSDVPTWLLYLMTRIQDFSFSIAGLVMIVATAGTTGLLQLKNRLLRFNVPLSSYLLALTPIVLYGAAALIAADTNSGAAVLDASMVRTLSISLHAGFLVSLLLRGAMGEELGLRGFALPHLQQRTTPRRASLVIGLGWAGWHLPVLVNTDPISATFIVLLIIGLSFVFTWLFNRSAGSLIPPLLFHGAQNWEEAFETIFPSIVETDWEAIAALGLLALSALAVTRVSGQRPGARAPAHDTNPPPTPSNHRQTESV
ncbi:MAG: CPBP family intramembrane glutamic endopeptidase [Acidimicrobiales bacterium]